MAFIYLEKKSYIMADRPLLITLIGLIYLLLGLVFTFIGALIAFGMAAELADLAAMEGTVLTIIGAVVLIFGLINLIIGWGFLRGWAIMWYLGVIFNAIGLLFTIGGIVMAALLPFVVPLVIYAVILYYLFRPNVKAFFGI